MVSPQEKAFVRRANQDGSTDSVCRACFVTVATTVWESDLDGAEKSHTCDPYLLEYWKKLAKRKPQ